jgi:hypothetical protein
MVRKQAIVPVRTPPSSIPLYLLFQPLPPYRSLMFMLLASVALHIAIRLCLYADSSNTLPFADPVRQCATVTVFGYSVVFCWRWRWCLLATSSRYTVYTYTKHLSHFCS